MSPRVDLWLVDTDDVDGPEMLESSGGLLDPSERARYERITHRGVKLQYLVTRALVRTTLSSYEPVEPRDWRFATNDHGCPHIDVVATGQPTDLAFNVSHTDGAIVLAVTRGRAVGVDVEDSERTSDTTKIAHRFFAAPEVAALKTLPADRQRERFFTYWTLKEAYIKARGMGLAIPLGRFWFDVDAPPAIGFDTDARLEDPPERWWFGTLDAGPRHPIAVALEAGKDARVDLRLHRGTLLGELVRSDAVLTRCSGGRAQ